MLFRRLLIFFQNNVFFFSEKFLQCQGPDLGPNCLYIVDDTRRQGGNTLSVIRNFVIIY